MSAEWVDVADPKPGDLAFHVAGHDPRRVMKVTDRYIWIDIMTKTVGPCPRENYTFRRQVGGAS